MHRRARYGIRHAKSRTRYLAGAALSSENRMTDVLRGALRYLGVVLSLAGIAFIVRIVAVNWALVTDAFRGISILWSAFAVATGIFAMLVMAIAWRYVLSALGAQQPLSHVLDLYFRGEVSKYVPGGVWSLMGRSELARRAGVEPSISYGSVSLSVALLYGTCAWVVVACVPFATRPLWTVGALAVGCAAVVALNPRVLAVFLRVGRRLAWSSLALEVPPWRRSLSLMPIYAGAWIGVGTATWALVRAVNVDVAWGEVVWAAAISWLAGFVAFPVPGGIGVREAVFASAMTTHSLALAATLAVLARLLFVFIDGAGAVLFWLLTVRKRRAVV